MSNAVQKFESMQKKNEDQAILIEALEYENEEKRATIETMRRQIKQKNTALNRYFQEALRNSRTVREQRNKLEKLKKQIAQTKRATKIQEDIFALKAKRDETENKIQDEIRALEAERIKAEMDLNMAGEDSDDEDDDD